MKKVYTFSRWKLALLLVGVLLAGVALSSVRHHWHTPMNPLFVDIYNETEEIIPSVVIEQVISIHRKKFKLFA